MRFPGRKIRGFLHFMVPATINIPISFMNSPVSWETKEMFVRLKAQGPILDRDACKYTRRQVRPLIALGWVGVDKDKYFLRAWRKIDKMLEGNGMYARLDPRQLLSKFKETIYMAATVWLIRIQPNSPAGASARASKGLLQHGEDTGGVSLSLMAEFFSMSKSWASWMRRKCTSAGLGFWTRRRYVVMQHVYEAAHLSKDDRASRYYKSGDSYFEEVTAKVEICIKCTYGKWWVKKK